MIPHPSIILGLTGGIACGKSEAGRVFSAAGFSVLDTDTLAHGLMEAGTPVFRQIVERFGALVVGANGEIDRVALGRIVFDDPSARETLNRLVHPAVIRAVEQWKAEQAGDAVVMIPLLFEVEWTDGWDAVVCVSADEETVFQRLEKRGLSKDEAGKRIAAQMPLAEKEAKADFSIENNGSLEALRNQVQNLMERIRNERNK